ncbi:MAG: Z1 domain-containing protein [Methylovirgula sp.]|nr:Z1 domain-containing protein [Methylovirgula sp.]
MVEANLIGVFEIAEMAGVTASAVANWRKRFPDFPAPLAELKSGPVFAESQIKKWLALRKLAGEGNVALFYDQLASKRGDPPELQAKVQEVVEHLQKEATSLKRPGILLGKVQSGKTRAYLGVIASAFDKGYDAAIILTKGTKSLAQQTLSRVKADFEEFIESDQIDVFDVLAVPDLTPYELARKLVFVVKKEDDNMHRLIELFTETYPSLRQRRVLIIDDEADLASVSGRRVQGLNIAGTISRQIDTFRESVSNSAYLQVTATPYALYLQPEDDVAINGNQLFQPKRPAFTVLLPVHEKYVGGDQYFGCDSENNSPGQYFYREVPTAERDALKKEDRRRLQIDRVLTEKNVTVMRDAIVSFIVGGTIRRLQQRAAGQRPQKYSFLFHTEQQRSSHDWQLKVVSAVRDALIDQAEADSPLFNELLRAAYVDLRRSADTDEFPLPDFDEVKNAVRDALAAGQLMITKVNSDNDVKNLLDDEGQLKLRTPFNVFIGGQILDRGITINSLIGFYYGRSPNRFQQDTVLQHSRMYGARPPSDLRVTRFYAPQNVYQIMKRIHEFDSALREAFESGAHERGIYFLRRDAAQQLVPCSPNKLLFSDVVSIRPGRRLVLSGFQTVSKSAGGKNLAALDAKIRNLNQTQQEATLITVEQAVELLELAYANLEFPDENADDDRQAHIVALEHLSRVSTNLELKGKVWLVTASDRDVARYREEGRFSNAPDTKQQKDAASMHARDIPVLMLLRQNGSEAKGWRGLPFWWPVILTPRSTPTVVFANREAISPSDAPGNKNPRSLATEDVT